MKSSPLAPLALASLLLLPSADASALDTREHNLFMRTSPAFAEADRELNALWKRLRAGLDRDAYQPLLSEQRAWLRGGWDRDAARLFPRMNRAAAYAQAARDRIADLKARYGDGRVMFRPAPVPPGPSSEVMDFQASGPLGGGRSAFFDEKEHRLLLRSSPEYADADRRMNALWRRLKATLHPDAYQRALAEQREWLTYRRSIAAGEYMDHMSRGEAYAAAVNDRIEEMRALLSGRRPDDFPAPMEELDSISGPVGKKADVSPGSSRKKDEEIDMEMLNDLLM